MYFVKSFGELAPVFKKYIYIYKKEYIIFITISLALW